MIRPTWVYHFKRHRKDGEGTRLDLVSWDGPGCYAQLMCPLKRTREPVVYLAPWRITTGNAPDPRKGDLILAAPGRRSLSSIYEPLPEYPGRGYGDLNKRKDAILTVRDEQAEHLTVYVFPNLGLQSQSLFLTWIDGGVCLEPGRAQRQALYNKPHLATESVTSGYA